MVNSAQSRNVRVERWDVIWDKGIRARSRSGLPMVGDTLPE